MHKYLLMGLVALILALAGLTSGCAKSTADHSLTDLAPGVSVLDAPALAKLEIKNVKGSVEHLRHSIKWDDKNELWKVTLWYKEISAEDEEKQVFTVKGKKPLKITFMNFDGKISDTENLDPGTTVSNRNNPTPSQTAPSPSPQGLLPPPPVPAPQ